MLIHKPWAPLENDGDLLDAQARGSPRCSRGAKIPKNAMKNQRWSRYCAFPRARARASPSPGCRGALEILPSVARGDWGKENAMIREMPTPWKEALALAGEFESRPELAGLPPNVRRLAGKLSLLRGQPVRDRRRQPSPGRFGRAGQRGPRRGHADARAGGPGDPGQAGHRPAGWPAPAPPSLSLRASASYPALRPAGGSAAQTRAGRHKSRIKI